MLSDGLGNVRFITDAVGNIVSKYDYDPFGNIRSVSGTALNNYQFQSEQLDPESSLYFLRARYYDPNTGRFISKDPIRGVLTHPQSLNPYAYALNDPVNLSDPSGKFVWDLIDVGFFGWSLQQFIDCPSWGNAGNLALDTLSLLPIIPSVGYITHADDVAKLVGKADDVVDVYKGSKAILKNGYYEVNGFKFSEKYYEKLWSTGRKAPSLVVQEVLEGAGKGVPDVFEEGFFRYEYGGWELIYNPITKVVRHLQPM